MTAIQVQSRTPYLDAEVAVWTWLSPQPTYSGLALKEFRGYDGSILPFHPEHGFASDVVFPCIDVRPGKIDSKRVGNGFQDSLELLFRLFYPGSSAGRVACESAFGVLRGLFRSPEAVRGKIDPHVIADFQFMPRGFSGLVTKDAPGVVDKYLAEFTLLLILPRNLAL